MNANKKVFLIIGLMLSLLSFVTVVNVAVNFRTFSKDMAIEKAHSVAEAVRDGLTAHMVNGTMANRSLFLENMIKHQKVKNLHLFRSKSVIEMFGEGTESEKIYSVIEDDVLKNGKSRFNIFETSDEAYVNVAIPYIATKYSNPNCLTCHANALEGEILGVISMDVSFKEIRSNGIYLILKIIFISIIFLILAMFVTRRYIKPYVKLFNDLEEGISKAYRGDFSHEVKTELSGEAGRVAQKLNELSEIFKFKKTIELDEKKETIYERLGFILEEHFNIKIFVLMEIDSKQKIRKVVHKTSAKTNFPDGVFGTSSQDCRAYRTANDVVSTDFHNICATCYKDGCEFICIPFTISEEYALILHIRTSSTEEIARIKDLEPIIKNYFELAEPVLESKFLMELLKDTTLKDAPTGLYNRRFLDEFMSAVSTNGERKFAVLMVDIDFFKSVNDTYGHDVGDKVILGLAKVFKQVIKGSDLAIRYGGEEFLIMLYDVSIANAEKIANEIRVAFSKEQFRAENESFSKTLSVGIGMYPDDNDLAWGAIKCADTALYSAKNSGRNKVIHYSEDMQEK
ncbi:MAG: diguanylate cyclase [Helicobacteraceae bacterium]|nr:diguanylate cyclase [Helicobacteraceae bacterium]